METETKRTNKNLLIKGIKIMGISLVLMFLGPTFLYIALSNTEKSLYIPILIVALIFCTTAVFLAFKGLKTIIDSMFKN
nr:DUF6095 family protein [uncultured Psychroserpens sp.]